MSSLNLTIQQASCWGPLFCFPHGIAMYSSIVWLFLFYRLWLVFWAYSLSTEAHSCCCPRDHAWGASYRMGVGMGTWVLEMPMGQVGKFSSEVFPAAYWLTSCGRPICRKHVPLISSDIFICLFHNLFSPSSHGGLTSIPWMLGERNILLAVF